MKKRKIVALVCVATVLLLAVSAFWYVQTKLDMIRRMVHVSGITSISWTLPLDTQPRFRFALRIMAWK